MYLKWNAPIFRFIKFKYILPWTDMVLSPTFERSKFLVTQINMNDNLKLLQKWQLINSHFTKIKQHRKSFTYNASFHYYVIQCPQLRKTKTKK